MCVYVQIDSNCETMFSLSPGLVLSCLSRSPLCKCQLFCPACHLCLLCPCLLSLAVLSYLSVFCSSLPSVLLWSPLSLIYSSLCLSFVYCPSLSCCVCVSVSLRLRKRSFITLVGHPHWLCAILHSSYYIHTKRAMSVAAAVLPFQCVCLP